MELSTERVIQINGQGIIPVSSFRRARSIEQLGFYALFSNTDICWYSEIDLVAEIANCSVERATQMREELCEVGLMYRPTVELTDEEMSERSAAIRNEIANADL